MVLAAEAWAVDGPLLAGATGDGAERGAGPDPGVGGEVRAKLLRGAGLTAAEVEAARTTGRRFGDELLGVLRRTGVLALPTIPCPPPPLGEPVDRLVWLTAPVNLAGFPALAVPVPLPRSVWSGGRASVQLVGPPGSEAQLLALGGRLEAAVA